MSIFGCIRSKIFGIWRWVYLVILCAWTIPFFFIHSRDVDPLQVAYPNLFFGVIPALLFLVLRYTKPIWACWFAYIYDLLVAVTLVIGLFILPNYLGLVYVFFLVAGFTGECILFLAVYVLNRPHKKNVIIRKS